MKSKSNTLIFAAAATALAVLLLPECSQSNSEISNKPPVKQAQVIVDSTEKEDSMKAFYERMRRWDALHGGMRQRESDK